MLVGVAMMTLWASLTMTGCKSSWLDPSGFGSTDTTNPQPTPTGDPPAVPISRAERDIESVREVVNAFGPVAAAAAPATGGMSEVVFLGVTNLLTLAAGLATEVRKRRLEYAIKQIHNAHDKGAVSLVDDPTAKAIVASVTSE